MFGTFGKLTVEETVYITTTSITVKTYERTISFFYKYLRMLMASGLSEAL
jgi:hypothetical protein